MRPHWTKEKRNQMAWAQSLPMAWVHKVEVREHMKVGQSFPLHALIFPHCFHHLVLLHCRPVTNLHDGVKFSHEDRCSSHAPFPPAIPATWRGLAKSFLCQQKIIPIGVIFCAFGCTKLQDICSLVCKFTSNTGKLYSQKQKEAGWWVG